MNPAMFQWQAFQVHSAQWFRTAKNRYVNTGPLACGFARLFARLIHSLAPPSSLHLHARLLQEKCMMRCLKTTWFCPTELRDAFHVIARQCPHIKSDPIVIPSERSNARVRESKGRRTIAHT